MSVGLLLGLHAAMGSAGPSSPPAQNGGRVPNLDEVQMFPRWLPLANIDPIREVIGPDETLISKVVHPSVAVDSENVAHVVAIAADTTCFQNTKGLPNGVYYYATHYATRRANGFSAAEPIMLNPPDTCSFSVDVAVAPDDVPHAVWAVDGPNKQDLYYGWRDPGTGWIISDLTMLPDDAFAYYGNPQIVVDPDGVVHIAAELEAGGADVILHFAIDGGVSVVTTVASSGTCSSLQGPRISLADEGGVHLPHVVFERNCAAGDELWHSYSTGPGPWSSEMVTISPDLAHPDICVDPDHGNTVHVVWADLADGMIRYDRIPPIGPEDVSTGSGLPVTPRVVVDSRGQPHVVWLEGELHYAARIDNPDLPPVDPWAGRQEPATTGVLMHFVDEVAINRNDGIYVVGSGLKDICSFTRTLELNLGEQDPYAMLPVAPGSAVNVTNGNLVTELPLFSSDGVGYSTALSLLYNSQEQESGLISQGWRHNYQMVLTDSWQGVQDVLTDHAIALPDVITLTFGDGRSVIFRWRNGIDQFLAEDEFGYFSKLERSEPELEPVQYLVTTKFGELLGFRTDGKLEWMMDTRGNTLLLEYGAPTLPEEGLLVEIRDSAFALGRPPTTFTYVDGRLESITDPAGRDHELLYGPEGLEAVTLNSGGAPGELATWLFTYHLDDSEVDHARANLLASLETPRGDRHEFEYYLDNRFHASRDPQLLTQPSIDDAGAAVSDHPPRTIDYHDPGSFPSPESPRAEYVDRRGFVTELVFEQRRAQVTEITDAHLNTVVREFDPDHRNVTRVVDREGNETLYVYTHESGPKESPDYVRDNVRTVLRPPANAAAGASASVPVVTYTYSDNISRVLTEQDALGNVTKYHYDEPPPGAASYAEDPDPQVFVGNLTTIAFPPTTDPVDGGLSEALEKFDYDGNGRLLLHWTPNNVELGPLGQATCYLHALGDGNDQTGLVRSICEPDHDPSQPETFTYDVLGNTLEHRMPEGGVKQTLFDGLGRVCREIAPAGDVTSEVTYEYDADSNLISVTGPGQASTEHEYDELGRLILTRRKISDDALAPIQEVQIGYHYDPNGNLRKEVDARQVPTEWFYDELDRLCRQVRRGTPDPDLETEYEYDGNGDLTKRTLGDPLNPPTQSTLELVHGARRLLLRQWNPATMASRELVYLEDGTPLRSERHDNGSPVQGEELEHDERGRLVRTTAILDFTGSLPGLETTFCLDANGNRRIVIDPEGRSTQYEYDTADRRLRTLDHLGTVLSETVYDDDDRQRLLRERHPVTGNLILSEKLTYNPRGELKRTEDIDGNRTKLTYDARGNVVLQASPKVAGATSRARYEYDLANRLVRRVRQDGTPDEIEERYEVDENGNRTKTIVFNPATGSVDAEYVFVYDDANRPSQLHYPPIGPETFVEEWRYDERGNLRLHVDPNGKETSWLYDPLDRPIGETHVEDPTGNPVTVADLTYEYDGASRLLTVHDAVSKVLVSHTDDMGSAGYDALGRPTHVRWLFDARTPRGGTPWKTIQYRNPDVSDPSGYDGASNLTHMIDPEGQHIEYVYDDHNRLGEILREAATVATFAYYDNGQRKEISRQNGTKTTFGYDDQLRVCEIETRRSDGTVLSRFEYTYDERDRRKRAVLPHLELWAEYEYDVHGRLTSESWFEGTPVADGPGLVLGGNAAVPPRPTTPHYRAAWTYDDAGNRSEEVAVTASGSTTTTYEYDAQSRLISETTAAGAVTLEYDKNGNRTRRFGATVDERYTYDHANRVETFERLVGPAESWEYRYAPTGQRLAKLDLLAGVEEWFMYDREDVVADYSHPGNSFVLERSYVSARGIDAKIARVDHPSGALLFYHGDAIGSVHELTDRSGDLVRQQLFTAWGEELPVFAPLALVDDRHGFVQREHDAESSLVHFRARSYDPRQGRFLQKDPIIGNVPTAHYLYASNDPVGRTDPTGLQDESVDLSNLRRDLKTVQAGQKTFDLTSKALGVLKSLIEDPSWKGLFKTGAKTVVGEINPVPTDPAGWAKLAIDVTLAAGPERYRKIERRGKTYYVYYEKSFIGPDSRPLELQEGQQIAVGFTKGMQPVTVSVESYFRMLAAMRESLAASTRAGKRSKASDPGTNPADFPAQEYDRIMGELQKLEKAGRLVSPEGRELIGDLKRLLRPFRGGRDFGPPSGDGGGRQADPGPEQQEEYRRKGFHWWKIPRGA